MRRHVFWVVILVMALQGFAFVARVVYAQTGYCNHSGAFGFSMSPAWSLGLAGGVLGVLVVMWWHRRRQAIGWAWILLFSAGFSNVLERVLYGCVFDYLKVPFWPIFNMADVALVVSVVFLGWSEYRRGRS